MNRNLILCALVVLTGFFSGCGRSEPYSQIAPAANNSANANSANVAPANDYWTMNGSPDVETAGVTDWVETYDMDTQSQPYYPPGHMNHRAGSVRCYPEGNPLYDANTMQNCYEMPYGVDRSKFRLLRYSRKNPAILQATKPNPSMMTGSMNTLKSIGASNTARSANTSSNSDYSTTNKNTGTTYSTKSTAATSSTPYKSSSYPRTGSTPYRSSSYPSTSSTPYSSSSYPSTSSTPYRSSPSTSSPPYKSSSTTRRRP